MLGLKVTPKKAIFFPFKDPKIFLIFSVCILFLFSFDFITVFTIERLVLNFSPVETKPLVSLGKHDPPYAGPALKNLLPILLSNPIPIEISSISMPVFSHKFAISFIKVIFVARKAFEAYLN